MLKKYLCMFLSLAMLAAVMTVPASAEKELPFTDVKETDWFYDSVSYAFENSLMAGTSQSRFEPQTPMSRAMFITVIGRLYGAEENESNNFIDVEKGSWYADTLAGLLTTELFMDMRTIHSNRIYRLPERRLRPVCQDT